MNENLPPDKDLPESDLWPIVTFAVILMLCFTAIMLALILS